MIEGIEKIKGKMLTSAKQETEKILDESKEKVESIKAENKKKIDGFMSDGKNRISTEEALFRNREIASSQMESRKMYMEAREKFILEIVDEALAGINKEKAYPAFIEKTLKENAPILGKGIIVLCSGDDVSLVEKIAKKLKLDVKVEKTQIKAGVILQGKESRMNFSIESIVEEKITTIRKEIVAIIGA